MNKSEMKATRQQYDEFFDSLVWDDIKNQVLGLGIQLGLAELSNPEIVDINAINFTRGKIEGLRILENLEQIVEGAFKHEADMRELDDENSDEAKDDSD